MNKEKITTCVRMPEWIYEFIKKRAEENRRTFTAEIEILLEKSIYKNGGPAA